MKSSIRWLVLAALPCLLWFPAQAIDLEVPPLAPVDEDGIHDPDGEAINRLQEPAQSMADFPTDRRGEVNWVRSLNENLIDPRQSLTADPWDEAVRASMVMDLDILFTNTADMPHVLFPHKPHTQWLDCSNCHFDIFIPQKGANDITMTKILAGEFCGRCHDKVAFTLWTCERCHSVPHEGSGEAWW